ncbi:MAG: winged helix DNA-binding domain-containing protein [Oscillospiraceae bacterium]|nr:winged helix DNA-binding domain-containing protein [Oscillospiraceae bacterium]
MYYLTKEQARRFILLKQGLIGDYRFIGKQGVLEYIRQTGCIQFDPVDVCGKNPELVLQSRVKGFKKSMLFELLYKDRELVDCFDKQLAIIPTPDWPYFERYRQISRDNLDKYPEIHVLMENAKSFINENGVCSSSELPDEYSGESNWFSAIHWSAGKNKARAVLEQLYTEGELIIHHKKGTRKYYDLAAKHIPADILAAPDPLPVDIDHIKWRMLRRIGAVGLLWNRPSDAWLGIWGFSTAVRQECFDALIKENKVIEVIVEGINSPLYCRFCDEQLLNTAMQNQKIKKRCELLAPLDCFIWDRKLIKALFDFDYAWEIYYSPDKRKYGHYVLPMIYGDTFAGRLEATVDRKAKMLLVKNIWYEEGFKQTKPFKKAEENMITRFAKFNECCQGNRPLDKD